MIERSHHKKIKTYNPKSAIEFQFYIVIAFGITNSTIFDPPKYAQQISYLYYLALFDVIGGFACSQWSFPEKTSKMQFRPVDLAFLNDMFILPYLNLLYCMFPLKS